MNRAKCPLIFAILLGPILTFAQDRPNVLCLIADDLRDELGCYGASHIHSPNIDSLAARGLVFSRAYCQKAVCGPSRNSFFSGTRPDTNQVKNNHASFRDAMPDIASLPEHFKNHGYFTASFGKVLHDGQLDPQSWSQPAYAPELPVYAAPENEGKTPIINRSDPANKVNPLFESADVEDTDYRDGLYAQRAIQTLRELPSDQPFLMMLGFHKPHTPFNAPKRYWDLYEREDIPLADNQYLPKGSPEFLRSVSPYMRSFAGIPEEGTFSPELQREIKHAYWACISYVDALIGQVLAELEKQGLADNTIIVFWSDHGYQLGEHDLWCKHTNYETSTKVPLIIVDPRRKPALGTTASLAELVDIYPTVAELAELPLPDHLEGTSLVPVLDDPKAEVRDAAFSQFPRGGADGLSLRSDKFRYTEWRSKKSGEVVARELYHHEKDPQENLNVAANPEYADSLRELEERLQEMWPR